MTVPYSHIAATARPTILLKVLFFRWDGSVWQLIKLEMLIWCILYLALNRFYHYYKDAEVGVKLYAFSYFIHQRENTIMLPFLLGFFTIITVNRWWKVYELMEWPDSVASSLSVHLRPKTSKLSEKKVQILRRTLAKYLQLSFVLLLRDISVPLRKRFPNLEAMSETKLLLNDQELRMIKALQEKVPERWCLYWVPFQWLFSNLKKCYFAEIHKDMSKKNLKKEVYEGCLFSSKYEYLHVIKELMAYRMRMGSLLDYDWMASPTLAFTQAIIFAVYGFIFFAIFSRQNFDAPENYLYVLAAVVEVGIYLAWLKCTLIMINPFGSDKDDFEVLWLTDRHWRVIYRILDDPWQLFPETTFTRSAHHARRMAKVTRAWPSIVRGSGYRELQSKAAGSTVSSVKLGTIFGKLQRMSAGFDASDGAGLIEEDCSTKSEEECLSESEEECLTESESGEDCLTESEEDCLTESGDKLDETEVFIDDESHETGDEERHTQQDCFYGPYGVDSANIFEVSLRQCRSQNEKRGDMA